MTRPRHSGRVRWTALAGLSVLVLAACSSGDESGQPTSPEDAENATRLTVDGLTLVYPNDVFPAADVADPGADGAAQTVEFETPAGPPAQMTVIVARTPAGEEVADLAADDRARLDDLEGLDTEDDSDDVVEFVNGVGRRLVNDDGYAFDGLTNDGRFLLGFSTAPADDADRLDTMIGTVFVDGAAEIYGTEVCADDVELINDNGLPEGATVAPGEEVTATWQIKNVGTCTWGSAYSWVFTGGEPVTVIFTGAVAEVGPGESTEVEAAFIAPVEPGQYAAQWQLQSPTDLDPLGTPAFVIFVVEP